MSAVNQRTGAARGALVLAAAATIATALVVTYLALGGGSYKPLEVADPCKPRALPRARGFDQVSQQLLLSALDGAACRLRVPREELALALSSGAARARFAQQHKISEGVLEDAIRKGLERAVVDAERVGRLSKTQASVLRAVVGGLPIATLIQAVRTGRGLAGTIGELLKG